MSIAAAPAAEPAKVELLLSQLTTLPMLAPVAVRLLNLTSRRDSDLKEIVQLIESDAALAAQVLSHAGRIGASGVDSKMSVERAAARLGFNSLRQIVLTNKIVEVFGTAGGRAGSRLNRAEFWKHCLAVACAANRIAVITKTCDPEEAFIAGLLHDLGKVALDACLPKSYDRVLLEAERRGGDLLTVERDILGTDHTVAGKRLAERWQLPAALSAGIWLHHLPPDGLPAEIRREGLVPIVWLADVLVRRHRLGFSGNRSEEPPIEAALSACGLASEQATSIIAAIGPEIETRAAWVGLGDVSHGRLYVQALTDSTRELTRMNEEAREQNRLLARQSEYFAAVCGFHRTIRAGGALADACAAAAEAVARALGLRDAIVLAASRDGGAVSCGSYSIGCDPRGQILGGPVAIDEAMRAAVRMSQCGTWLTPAPATMVVMLDECLDAGAASDGGEAWAMPIVRDGHWMGAAAFHAEPGRIAELRLETGELEALSTGIGAVLGAMIEHEHAVALGENLVWAQQRLAAAQGELAAARALRSTSEIAAGAAHELNTPLALISGRGQMLRERLGDETQRRELTEMIDAAHRASDIVSDLMAFAEPPKPNTSRVDVAATVGAAVQALGAAANCSIEMQIAAGLPPVLFDPQHLRGVIDEILGNAVEAIPPSGGRVVVKGVLDQADETIVMTLTDNGRGMTADVRERAFDPFFSARVAGRGRGMGLARVLRWMQANGGRVSLDSSEGGGTCVTLRLASTRKP